MSTIVDVTHLVKRFGDLAALDDVPFAIEQGEIFGLLGPNGMKRRINIAAGILRKPKVHTLVLVGFAAVTLGVGVKMLRFE